MDAINVSISTGVALSAAAASLVAFWLLRRRHSSHRAKKGDVAPEDKDVVILHMFQRWRYNPNVCLMADD